MRYFSILLPTILCFPVLIFSQSNTYKIHPDLQKVLNRTTDEIFVDVYVKLNDRLDANNLIKQNAFLDKKEKRNALVKSLKQFTAEKQKNIMLFLKEEQSKGKVKKLAVLWTLNYFIFSANSDVIYKLANDFNELKEIRYDPKYSSKSLLDRKDDITKNKLIQPENVNAINPGITMIEADDVWAEGYTGQGVLIANNDEGCAWTCADLINRLWQNLGEDADSDGKVIQQSGSTWIFDPDDENGFDDDGNGYADDFVGWDFRSWTNNVMIGESSDEINGTYHGTACACLVVGDGASGKSTGVAPGAKLINFRLGHTLSGNLLASQYAIEIGVDIITQSQSFKVYEAQDPDYAAFREMTEVELAAGIIHFNSMSNDGDAVSFIPPPFNVSCPANCPPPWLHPDQTLRGTLLTSAMGIGNIDVETGEITYTSPYGPCAWEDFQTWYPEWHLENPIPVEYRDYPIRSTDPQSMGLIKPDVSAPGENTESITYDPENGFYFLRFYGTSAATPHTAGVAALLLSVNPYLTPSDICRILQTTATDLGDTGKDNRYGAGLINAYNAFQEALSELPVELISFSAVVIDNDIELNWSTATEINNYGFEIQKASLNPSEGGTSGAPLWGDWGAVGFVNGHGNSNSPKEYSFIDENISIGSYEYRLKEIDNDGTYKYSNEVNVTVVMPTEFSLEQNYPNPFNPTTKIKYSIPKSDNVQLKVYDILGKEIATIVNDYKQVGNYETEFNSDSYNLTSGIYFYQLKAGDFQQTKKMLLLR